ncbi:TIR domain-containing protein [Streptomyces sp. NPDC055400]
MDRRNSGDIEHDAFISYSHAWDKDVAKAFHSQLQAFDRPWYRPRNLRLFRDETNLAASPHLWTEIERALTRSRWLVLMASPSAAASRWVRDEIRWWLTHRSPDTLLIAWTDGTLVWDGEGASFDWSQTDALPREEMAEAFDQEPRWVDLRWLRGPEQVSSADPRLIECVAEFAAPLTGKSKDELIGDHVRQRRRTVRWVQATVAVLTTLLLVAVAGGVTAYNQRNSARAQTMVAQSRQLVASASSIQDAQPDLARQLLAQAYRLSPTAEAMGALVQSYEIPRVIHARGTMRAAAFSRRGVLAVADDGVRLFDPATKTLVASVDVPDSGSATVAFNADGRVLAVGGATGDVRLFDVTSSSRPKFMGVLSAAVGRTEALVFTSGGKLIVIAEKGGAVVDVKDPAHPRSLGPLPAATIGASPQGNLIVTDDAGGRLQLWNLSGSARLTRAAGVAAPHSGVLNSVLRVTFSSDGKTLAAGGGEDWVRLWDVSDPAHPAARPDLYAKALMGLNTVALSPDGTTLATGDSDGSVTLWDVSDPLRPRSGARLTGHTEWVYGLSFSPDGHTLASVSTDGPASESDSSQLDGTVRLWSLSGSERTSAFTTLPVAGTYPPSFSPDSHLLAAGGEPATVWRTDGRRTPRLVATLDTFKGGQAAFGSDGRTLFSGLPLAAWDMTDPAGPRRLTPDASRPGIAGSVSLNPVLPLLAARDRPGGSVQLWDVSSRKQPELLDTLSDGVMPQALAFSPDGELLAAATEQGSVRLWHVAPHARPTPAGDLTPAGGKATALAFSPVGRSLLVGDDAGSITTWNVARPGSPVQRGTSAQHTGEVRGLAFHPDGALAASAGLDGRIELWDVTDLAHPRAVTALSGGGLYPAATVAFSPDGRLLAVSGDRGMRLWTVDRTTILQRLCAESRRITRDQWTQYLPDRSYDPPCA